MERKGLVGRGGLGCCILGHLKVNSAKKKPCSKSPLYLQYFPLIVLFCTMGDEQLRKCDPVRLL